jgi:NTE family protein
MRIGLALAGGGPLGAIYEIGALCALEDSLRGLDLTRMDGYVGVSAGAFIAAALANRMTARELCSAFIENDGHAGDVVDPDLLLKPAWGEFAKRLAATPKLAALAGWDYAVRGRSKLASLERLGRALPTGLFDGTELQKRLAKIFDAPGRTNDFRRLNRRLVLVATALDTGEAVPFGLPGHDHVPISVAVQASGALPGMFPPVTIDGQSFVDGALKKTLHASVLLDEGVELLLCLNPLVPFDATSAREHKVLARGEERIPHMVDGGLPLVLSQTFRSLIHSRLALGMKGYASTHPKVDIVLFEPDHRDSALFLANTFSVSQRARLAEHAYQRTRETLRSHRASIGRKLGRHGVTIDDEALADDTRRLITNLRGLEPASRTANAIKRLDAALDNLDEQLSSNPRRARAAARPTSTRPAPARRSQPK